MQKKNYETPDLIVYGNVQTLTGGNGFAYGHSCGNGNVSAASDCGVNIQIHDDNGRGYFKNHHDH